MKKTNDYEYEYTEENGYFPVEVSREQHQVLFPRRKLNIFTKYEYFYNEKLGVFIVIKLDSVFLKTINTFLYPLNVLFFGFNNFRDLHIQYKLMYFQKQSGSFCSDRIFQSQKKFEEIQNLIKF